MRIMGFSLLSELLFLPVLYNFRHEYKNNKYTIDILYSNNQNKYKLRFFFRELGSYSDELINVLTKNSFRAINEFFVKYVDEKDILNELNSLCENLKKIA